MALNFPNSPTLNQVYTDTTSGFSYQWNGTVWISFSAASSNQIKVLDDISGSFTGIAFTFALTSSGTSISPPNAQSLIINLGGVIQDPSDDYIVSGSNIIFSTAPTNGLSFSGVSLGPAIPVNTIPDGTVTDGSLTVAGILSTTNLYVAGVSTFVGLATHTGTIFGSNLSLTGVATATTFVGSLTGTASTASFATTSFGLSGSPNITVGIATATTLKVGTGVTISSGVVTATEFDITGSSNTFNAGGLNVGVATATTFVGALTGNATGLSGTPNITVGNITGTAATFTNLTVNGTQTIINTTSLEISDKNIGIGSTSSPSDALADGAGITIYGTTNKTLTWDNSNSRMSFSTNVYSPKYYGDGSQLTGVSAGLSLKQAGSVVAGGAATTVNFASGATITSVSAGIATITIAAGIVTEALVSSGIVTTLSLSSAQDHKVTATGITTITVSGGTEGDSHTVRIVNSGIATVGFSTYFLFPSGSAPVLPTTSGAISLLSFTVHRVGTAGTQLLAGASLNFS